MRIIYPVIITGLALLLTAQATSPNAFDPFAGKWAGTLEYKDYGGNGRVKIPVKLEVKTAQPTQATWDFAYDDFGRKVTSFETHTWQNGTYRISTEGQTDVQTYTSTDFAHLLESGTGKAVLIGQELETGRKLEVRRTITLEASKLTTLKETRPKGGVFAFSNQSTYTRQP